MLSIVTASLLGVKGFGELGIITVFVSNVNRLLSFRMGDVVVKYMGEALERGETRSAPRRWSKPPALIEGAHLAGGLWRPGAAGARWARPVSPKIAALAPLFLLYGVSILANITTETATGVLQVTGHFRSQALINLAQSVLVAG